jgi:hypothetical protein
VNQNSRTYDEVISNRRGQRNRRAADKEETREEARKKQNKRKLRYLLPSLSQLIQDLPRGGRNNSR